MPQDPQPQGTQLPSVPGEDKLLDIIRNSPLRDSERRQLWETYHTPGDEKAFTGALNKLDMNDETKRAMYEMRWLPSKPSPTTQAASSLDTRPRAKGDVRPSTTTIYNQQAAQKMIDPYLAVGQQTLDAFKDAPSAFKPSFSPQELEQGKDLITSLLPVDRNAPPSILTGTVAAHAGATLRRAGQLGSDVLGAVSSPFNLATAGIQQHISTIIEPWQNLARQMFSKESSPDPKTGRYSTGNEDIDKALDTAVGAIPFILTDAAMTRRPTPLEQSIDQMRGQAKVTPRSERPASDVNAVSARTQQIKAGLNKTTPIGPISETGGQQLHLDFATKAPTEAQAPVRTDGASKSGNAPVVDKQAQVGMPSEPSALIAPKPGLPTHDALVDAMIAKGVDNRFAEVRADQLLDAASGKSGFQPVERRNAPTLIDHYMGEERRGVAPKAEEAKSVQARIETPKVEAPKPEPSPVTFGRFMGELHRRFDSVADLGRQADLAENDQQANDLQSKSKEIERQTRDASRQYMNTLPSESVEQHQDAFLKGAERLEAQSKGVKDKTENTIKNRGIKGELVELRSGGGPVQSGIDPRTGEKIAVKPEATVRRAFRSLADEAQGRVPTSPFDDIEIIGLPEGPSREEGKAWLASRLADRKSIARKFTDLIQVAQETGASIHDLGIEDLEKELRAIDIDLGKYTKPASTGRRPNVTPEVDENGAIKPNSLLDSWTKKEADLVFGRNLRSIPTDEEFFQHAETLKEKGRLFRGVAEEAQRILDQRRTQPGGRQGERGAIGEPLRGKVTPVSLETPSVDDFITRVKRLGKLVRNPDGDLINTHRGEANITVSRVTPETTEGAVGFLLVDSKGATHFIDNHIRGAWDVAMHEEVAEAAFPHLKSMTIDKALQAILSNPDVVRKAGLGHYEFNALNNSRVVKAVELDLIKDRQTNREVRIQSKDNSLGKSSTLTIEPGWEDLGKAIEKAKARQGWNQRGVSGTTSLVSGTAGALVGMKVGGILGGPVGGAIGGMIGFTVGFTAPEVLTSPRVRAAAPFIKTLLSNANMRASQFFNGPTQRDYPSPQLQAIQAEQQMHQNRSTTWLERTKALPAQMAKGIDPFVYVQDKNNMGYIARGLMAFDKAGKVFRNLNIPDIQSLYLALRDAKGRALGQRWYQQMQYSDIKADAKKAGLMNSLEKLLNLKAYQRGFDVLEEHKQDLQQKMQQTQQDLQNPNNTVRENIAFQDKLKELQKYHDEIDKKVAAGEAVPGSYTPQTLQQELSNMQQWHGLNDWTRLNDLSNRVFKSREHILDLLHSNGLITDEAYQKYVSRGNEYIPLERIMDDMAENKVHSSTQPLHLRQQTVIKTLEGSSRTNVSPWEALAHADAKAFNQIIRNDTMRHAVDLATAYPATIGLEFKEVKEGYRAKKGESILGHYVDGKPNLYAVPEYLGDAMQNYPAATKTALGAVASWWGHQFKRGATVANLSFQAASLIGHAGAGLILSESNRSDVGRFAANWGRSFKSVLTQDQEFREMVRSGAAFGGWQAAIDPEYAASPSDIGTWEKLKQRKILDAAQDVATMLENVNRTNTWRNARLDGHNERSASFEAKYRSGAPDFSRMGDLTQPLNQAFMFVNAATQYTAQMMDALRKDPKRIGGVLAATAAATIALQAWNAQQKDSDGNSLLRKVNVEERLRNWTVLLPWTYKEKGVEKAYHFNIPKPYPAQFMINPVEAAVSNIIGKEDRTGTQQALDVLGHMSPIRLHLDENKLGSSLATSLASATHPVIKTAVQQFANKDDFGYPIVPPNQQDIDPQFQFGPRTSAPAKAIGRGGALGAAAGGTLGAAVGGLMGGAAGAAIGGGIGITIGARGASPRRVEAGVRSMFAGSASQTESYLNPFFEASTNTKAPETLMDKARTAPIVGPTISRFMGSQMDQQMATASQQFYGAADNAEMPLKTIRYLQQNLPEEAPKYLHDHKAELEKGFVAEMIRSRLTEIDSAMKTVQGQTKMPAKEMEDQLERLYKAKMYVLDVGNKALRPGPQVGQASALPGQGQGAPR